MIWICIDVVLRFFKNGLEIVGRVAVLEFLYIVEREVLIKVFFCLKLWGKRSLF